MRTRILASGLALVLLLTAGAGSAFAPAAGADHPVSSNDVAATERAATRGPTFTDEQRRVAQLVNDTRSDRGKRRLTLNVTLTRKAQQWAEILATTNRLAHSELTAGVPPNWRALGENVGYAATIVDVHRAFMRSSGHRHNILGRWNAIGTGYASNGNGRVFVVHVFMRT